MMNDHAKDGQAQEPQHGQDRGPGLCEYCVHVQVVTSQRGSTFYLCRLSYSDPAFPRYPPIPVLSCAGFVRSTDRG
jgi:hypothetical protein